MGGLEKKVTIVETTMRQEKAIISAILRHRITTITARGLSLGTAFAGINKKITRTHS